jgi:3-keto-L-gulonate-6-phosphate decarboxylase
VDGIRAISRHWKGHIVADLKTLDGAYAEVLMAKFAGATAATTLGNAPVETLDIFIATCEELQVDSMIDMLGVADPLKVILHLKKPPDVVILHRGRDEESTRGKVIQYRHVNRLRSKFDALISAAGGVDLKEARSAIFNGANIVVVNLVKPGDPWEGISTDSNVAEMARHFLDTIE